MSCLSLVLPSQAFVFGCRYGCDGGFAIQIVEYVFEQIRAVTPQVVNLTPAVADVIGKAVGFFPRPLLNADRVRVTVV